MAAKKKKLENIVTLNKIYNVYFLGSYKQDYVCEIYKKVVAFMFL